jgi:hypothetical protein
MKNCIIFKNETEMSFWMGIYQTALRTETPVTGCDFDWDAASTGPDITADKAIRDFRKRMISESTTNDDRYHNSPSSN